MIKLFVGFAAFIAGCLYIHYAKSFDGLLGVAVFFWVTMDTMQMPFKKRIPIILWILSVIMLVILNHTL